MPAKELGYGVYDMPHDHPNVYALARVKIAIEQLQLTKERNEIEKNKIKSIEENTKALDNIARILSVKATADLTIPRSEKFLKNTLKELSL